MTPDDNKPAMSYNTEDFPKVVERIDLNNLPPLNDTAHPHQMVRDFSDETEDYYAMKCTHPRCFRGYLVSKHETPDEH